MHIIFQDKDILIISKPPGVVVNTATSVRGETIQGWMKEYLSAQPQLPKKEWEGLVPEDFSSEFGTPEEIFAERIGMVHRLDKDTSGVLILAKNPGALVNLLSQFKKRSVQKKYTCLTHGKFRVPEGNINAPLDRSRQDRKKFAVNTDGREAETYYKVVQEYPSLSEEGFADINEKLQKINPSLKKVAQHVYQQGFSLVECFPKTGRTHQIRVHMSHWKHPLVGDKTYVGKKRSKLDPLWCPRHFLHASELSINHPRTGERVTFTADLPDDLKTTLSYMA